MKKVTKKKSSSKDNKKRNAEKKKVEKVVKEIEKALFAVKFYPVAVDEDAKNDALKKLESIYLILFLLHVK